MHSHLTGPGDLFSFSSQLVLWQVLGQVFGLVIIVLTRTWQGVVSSPQMETVALLSSKAGAEYGEKTEG